MSNQSKRIPVLEQQSIAVDFIDNKLPQYHDIFAGATTQYDRSTGHSQPASMMTGLRNISHGQGYAVPKSGPPPRPQPSAVAHMSFWIDIFPSAMESFNAENPNEPKRRSDFPYSIRHSTAWTDVYSRLLAAQQAYENPQGIVGNLKKGMRKTVDNSQWLRGAVGLVPDMDITTTVTSILKVLLDVGSIVGHCQVFCICMI